MAFRAFVLLSEPTYVTSIHIQHPHLTRVPPLPYLPASAYLNLSSIIIIIHPSIHPVHPPHPPPPHPRPHPRLPACLHVSRPHLPYTVRHNSYHTHSIRPSLLFIVPIAWFASLSLKLETRALEAVSKSATLLPPLPTPNNRLSPALLPATATPYTALP